MSRQSRSPRARPSTSISAQARLVALGIVAQLGDIQNVLVGVALVGIVKAQHQVDLVVGDAGGDLLAAAVDKGQKPVHLQAGGLLYLLTGVGGGAQGVLRQNAAVGGAELHHQLFPVIVGDQGNIHSLFTPYRIVSPPGAAHQGDACTGHAFGNVFVGALGKIVDLP